MNRNILVEAGRLPFLKSLWVLLLISALFACQNAGTENDSVAPSVALETDSAIATQASVGPITWTLTGRGTATDNVRVARMGYTLNGGSEIRIGIRAGVSVAFSFSFAVAEGTKNILVVNAYDSAGNKGSVSKEISINDVGVTPPTPTPTPTPPTPPPPPPTNTLNLQNGSSQISCDGKTYPTQWLWGANGNAASAQPLPASNGTPKIEQYRNGQLVATYSHFGFSGSRSAENIGGAPDPSGGAFSRSLYRQFADGDEYLVYPAVYEGETQQPFFGALASNDAEYALGPSVWAFPKNIKIRGVTVNGVRPVLRLPATGASNNTLGQSLVYFAKTENLVFENFDIESAAAGPSVGRSAIFVDGSKNLTLRNLRIHGFKYQNANGIFGAGENSGTLKLENLEMYNNGGDGGPEHNFYLNRSAIDPAFTVQLTGSYSHDVYYGHLFKSRAQRNVLEGNYFMGTASNGGTQTENFLVDIPNGGILSMRNNVLVKNASGDNSNGMMVTFKMEGASDARPDGVTIEHNTFVALARYYDSQSHQIAPFSFFYPQQNPSAPNFPISNFSVNGNAFIGLCQHYTDALNYRGNNFVEGWFDVLNQDFSLRGTAFVPNGTTTQSPSYVWPVGINTRTNNQVGARE